MLLFCYWNITFVNTCGGSDGAEVTVADDLETSDKNKTYEHI